MYFDGKRVVKRLLAAGFMGCAAWSFVVAQPKKAVVKPTVSVDAMLAQANDELAKGNLAQAEILLQKVLRADSRNVTAHTLFGAAADRQNDLKTAEIHFAQAAKLSPKLPETHNNYGVILLRLNRRNEAAKEFETSLAINPQQASALVNLAQIRFDEKNFPAARGLFEQARAIAPDARVLQALVMISLETNEKTRAQADFKDYFDLAKAEPNADLESLNAFGKLLTDNSLLIESEQLFNFVLAKDENNVNALILLSKVYLTQKNIKSAGRILESAVSRNVEDAKVYAALADVYQAGGFYENAVPAMRLAIEKEPRNEVYITRYGLLLIDAKAPAAAVIRLNEAAAQMPGSARIRLVLGMAQQIEGKLTDARGSFERSLQIDPQSVAAMAYLATNYIAQAQYAEAVKLYRKAISVEETNAILHYLLADTLLKIPTSDEAEIQKNLVRSVELDGKLPFAHTALGKVYARAENWQAAAAEFEQAVKYAPDSAESYYQLSRALARLKRADESKIVLAQFKKLSESQSAQKETDRLDLVRRLANVQF